MLQQRARGRVQRVGADARREQRVGELGQRARRRRQRRPAVAAAAAAGVLRRGLGGQDSALERPLRQARATGGHGLPDMVLQHRGRKSAIDRSKLDRGSCVQRQQWGARRQAGDPEEERSGVRCVRQWWMGTRRGAAEETKLCTAACLLLHTHSSNTHKFEVPPCAGSPSLIHALNCAARVRVWQAQFQTHLNSQVGAVCAGRERAYVDSLLLAC